MINSASEYIIDNNVIGTSLLLRYNGNYLFGIKYKNNGLYLTGIGGKVEKEEALLECVIRESIEEINQSPKIIPCKQTLFINLRSEVKFIESIETMPFSIVHKEIEINKKKMILTVFIYLGKINNKPEPIENLPLLVTISNEIIKRIVLNNGIALKDLIDYASFYIKKDCFFISNELIKFTDSPETLFFSLLKNNIFDDIIF